MQILYTKQLYCWWKKGNLFSLFLMLSLIACKAQTDNYDLGFENRTVKNASWLQISNNVIIGGDTTDCIEGKSALAFFGGIGAESFEGYVFKTINLPIESPVIELSIQSKSKNIEIAWLKLYCLGAEEELLCKDSVRIVSQTDWQKFTLKMQAEAIKSIYVEICAMSKDTVLNTSFVKRKLSVDNLIINLDNLHIGQFPVQKSDCTQNETHLSRDAFFLLENNHDKLIESDAFQKHSIVAFGETIHGSKESLAYSYSVITKLIESGNCRLVLFEIPFEVGLHLNEFVKKGTPIKLDELLFMYNFDFPSLNNFLNFVKQFNKVHESQVAIMGLDQNKGWQVKDNLLSFLENINSKEVKISKIINCVKQKNYSQAIEIIKSETCNMIDTNTKESIIYAISLRKEVSRSHHSLLEGNREIVQFHNAKFAIETFIEGKEKTAIIAHFGHVNKKNNMGGRLYTPSFGNYMRRKYSNDYFVIATLVGKGLITSYGDNLYGYNYPLVSPPKGSLEEFCLSQNQDIFFMNSSNLRTFDTGRFIGASYTVKQFRPFSIFQRADGIMYINRSTGTRHPESWPKTQEELVHKIRQLNRTD